MIVMLGHGLVSGALFLCVGVDLRPAAHARDRPLRRAWRQHARLCLAVHGVHHGQRRPARHQRLRRRVPEPGRHLSCVDLGGDRRRPPASSSAPPTCCGSTGGSASATQRNADAAAMPDSSAREWWLLAPIALAVFWMGIYPESFMRPIRDDVGRLLDAARARRAGRRFASDAGQGRGMHMDAWGGALMGRFAAASSRADPGDRRHRPDDGRRLRRPPRRRRSSAGCRSRCCSPRRPRWSARRRTPDRCSTAWSPPTCSRASARRSSSRRRRSRSSPRTAGSSATPSMRPNMRC